MENKSVTRTDLLTVHLSEFHCISNVEIKQIVIPPAGKAEYHCIPALLLAMSFRVNYYFKKKVLYLKFSTQVRHSTNQRTNQYCTLTMHLTMSL